MLVKLKRLARLAFYLGIGSATALVSACASATKKGSDAASPQNDSSIASSVDSGEFDTSGNDSVGDGANPTESSTVFTFDAGTGYSDGGDGGDLWDVVYE